MPGLGRALPSFAKRGWLSTTVGQMSMLTSSGPNCAKSCLEAATVCGRHRLDSVKLGPKMGRPWLPPTGWHSGKSDQQRRPGVPGGRKNEHAMNDASPAQRLKAPHSSGGGVVFGDPLCSLWGACRATTWATHLVARRASVCTPAHSWRKLLGRSGIHPVWGRDCVGVACRSARSRSGRGADCGGSAALP